jgi:hypothetical protein
MAVESFFPQVVQEEKAASMPLHGCAGGGFGSRCLSVYQANMYSSTAESRCRQIVASDHATMGCKTQPVTTA